MALGTLATFAFHQWTQKCTSGLTFFLTTSVLAFALLTLGLTSFLILRISKRPDGLPKLFAKDSIYGRRWGSMYDTLNERHLYFAVVLWVIAIIRAAITGFGQSNGLAQVVAMTVLQLAVCTSEHCLRTHYYTSSQSVFQLSSNFSRTTAEDITGSAISSKVPS